MLSYGCVLIRSPHIPMEDPAVCTPICKMGHRIQPARITDLITDSA